MDYIIIAVVSISGLYFHWWIYVRIKRWVNRDLALSMAGQDAGKRSYMLDQLQLAEKTKVRKKDLQDWLQQAADRYHPS